MVDLPSQPLKELDPQFEKVALETGAFTYGIQSTTPGEKLLFCIANDICRGHLGLAYRLHVTAAIAHGMSIATIMATVRFMGPYAGYPASADALAALGTLAAEVGLDLNETSDAQDDVPTRPEHGQLFGSEDTWLHEFVVNRTERAWGESSLSEKLRVSLPLVADVVMQTLNESFAYHVELARSIGLQGRRDP